MSRLTPLFGLLLVTAAVAGVGACNEVGDCPADAATIHDGDPCSGEGLQCAQDVTFTACDGTQQTIASSCTCTEGAWSCPSEPDCDAGGGGDDAGEDAADASEDVTADAPEDVATDAPADAATDAPADAATDAPADAATDAPADAASE